MVKTWEGKEENPAKPANGLKEMVNYWAARGVDKNALNLFDGSGLSPATRVTTYAMANILFQAQKEPWFAPFHESLPENNGMKLKSGSINDVSAYAGYYTNAAGAQYIVVININNYSGSGINKKLFSTLNALK